MLSPQVSLTLSLTLTLGLILTLTPTTTVFSSQKSTSVAASVGHSMVIMKDGTVWATGMNDRFQLGSGSDTDMNRFTIVARTIDGECGRDCDWCAVA